MRHAFGDTFRQVGRACRQVGKGKTKHPAPVKSCNHFAVFFRPCAFQGKNKHPLPAARLAVFDKDMNVPCTPSGSSPAGGSFPGFIWASCLNAGGRDPDHGSRTEDKKTKRAVPPREKNDAFLWSTQAGRVPRSARSHYTTNSARPSPSSSFAGGLMIIKGRLLFTSRRAAAQTGTRGTSSRNPQQ